jgi:hypothetical protein
MRIGLTRLNILAFGSSISRAVGAALLTISMVAGANAAEPREETGFGSNLGSLSELRKVLWHLPLELGEIARDRRHIEMSEDRFLWLAVEQEPEGRLEIALRGMLTGR